MSISKANIIVPVVTFVLGIGVGAYYFKSTTVTEQTKVVDRDTDTKREVKRVVTKRPDGTEITEETQTDEKRTSTTVRDDRTTKTVAGPKNNISALAGLEFKGDRNPVYGVSYTREFLGPVTLGAFGQTNGVVGLSVGINF